MNWMYLVAGALAAGGVVFHGIYGYLQVPAKLQASTLPRSVLGDGQETLWMLRLGWQTFTVVLAVGAFVFISLGLDDTGATGAPRAVGAILAAVVVAWIIGGGSRRRFLHPGLPIVTLATVLTLVGTL